MPPFDFDALWNYSDPAETEAKFRALLPNAEDHPDPEYHVQLLTQIARTLGLQRKFEEAHVLLDKVESLLTEQTPAARVRYLLERGRAYNSSGKKERANPLFVEAWDRARELGADFHAVDAAHMVAIAETGEAGLEWNMTAIEYAEQSEDERARGWLGSLYNNTGWSYHDLGAFEKALDLFERALAFREQQGNPANIRIARWCIARCLRSLGRVDEALQIQLALLEEARQAGSPDGYTHEELGELLILTGQVEQARPHFAAAYATLSQDPWLVENEPERLARLQDLGEKPPQAKQ